MVATPPGEIKPRLPQVMCSIRPWKWVSLAIQRRANRDATIRLSRRAVEPELSSLLPWRRGPSPAVGTMSSAARWRFASVLRNGE